MRTLSQFTRLQTAVNIALGDTSLQSLEENKDHHDLHFLASSIGVPFTQVAYLFISHVFAQEQTARPDSLWPVRLRDARQLEHGAGKSAGYRDRRRLYGAEC